jgi:glycosyltransferase involved in cell wall biosynthesis
MRILYDARKISRQAMGVGYVVKKLLEQLVAYKDLEMIAFTRKGVKNIFCSPFPQNLIVHETDDDSEYFGLKRVLFEQNIIPRLIDKYNPDILHLTTGFGAPLFFSKKNLKIVLTIHDLIPLTKYKELMSAIDNFIFKILFTYGVKKADAIVTVSKFTGNDVKKCFPNVEKIYTAYNGIEPIKKINNFDEIWSNLQKKYNIKQEFILYIGGFAPRKNVLRLLEVYNKLVKDKKYICQLLLCGKFTKNRNIQNQLNKINQFITSNNLQNQVRLIGYLNLDEKCVLLSKAKIFVYLSLYEGFGLPILEASSVAVPTITSKNSVMEEIAQEYACYADPINNLNILSSIYKVFKNYHHYKIMAESAKINLIPKYSWLIAGEKYYNIYTNLL